ncbi:hypothetical protein [Massilia sp. ST3]|uniref:hypothetical protein n=1 Tax=Massilia sp. ST3 TaxID=2824903 RepID=UPI001B813FDF|nr:hypothetical protein [Massilia sp. ST3]MBQ5947097.1 hypothetical protein [Massilia sp. ST3]
MEQLNMVEVEQVSGGWIAAAIAAVSLAMTAVDAYDDFMEGWNSVGNTCRR